MTIKENIARVDSVIENRPRAMLLADAAGMLLTYAAFFAEREMPDCAASAEEMAERLNCERYELLGVRHDHD